MKLLILTDVKIPKRQHETVLAQLTELYKTNATIEPQYTIEQYDFTTYPTYVDSDGDKRPTDAWLAAISANVWERYKESIDHIVLHIHQDNWQSDPPGAGGIWGTNYSFVWNDYQLQYCRWDAKNTANSLGTLYHEIHHSHDAVIKTYLGVSVERLVGVVSWDRDVTHGMSDKFKYIRHKENLDALQIIGPYLKAAYAERNKLHLKRISQMQQIIELLQRIVVLYRSKLNRQHGVSKQLAEDNTSSMSKTYIGAILQFLLSIGFITNVEMAQLNEFVMAVVAIIPLLVTLWGRFTATRPVNLFGFRQ